MRVNDAPVPSDGKFGDEQLELLTDDEGSGPPFRSTPPVRSG